jgi:hypothetical protein
MENIDTDYQLLKEQTICAEINLYRSIVSIDYDLDPLGWWKTNHHLYPSISKIAKKVLSIQLLLRESSHLVEEQLPNYDHHYILTMLRI